MTVEKFHPTTVTAVQGSKELGQQVMAMRYDLVYETLQGMVTELERQINGDERRGRLKLAAKLRNLQTHILQAEAAARDLVACVEPWLREEKLAAGTQNDNPGAKID